ncbi:hypothetical protein HZA33_02110 [Candidatus Pacearchaeota archaeon]|nr:hypothetical protein [Candidatus Pacearchaeota archaeon]
MKKWLSGIILLLSISLVAAQYYSNELSTSSYVIPSELLNNPYVVFGLFFALFFAAIYFALGRSMQGNIVVPAVISAVLAFVIAAGAQQNWTVMQRPVMFWAMLLAAALIIMVLVLGFIKYGGLEAGIGIVAGIYGLWPIIKSSLGYNITSKMPYELVTFLDRTWWIGLIFAIIMLLYAGWRMSERWKLYRGMRRI